MGIAVIKRSATLREQVVDALLGELRKGEFAPGDRLTEQGLAERLDVSRTPVREALNRLTEQGLLQARPGGGYMVPSPTVQEIHQIFAVRMLIEPPAVRMAAMEYDADQVKRIGDAIAAEMVAAHDPHPMEFARAIDEFRRAIFDGIANQALRDLISQFANHLSFIRAATLHNMDLRREILDRQRELRDAIDTRDGDLAENLWRAYLCLTEKTLVDAMDKLAQLRAR